MRVKKGLGATKPWTNGNTVSKMTEGYREEQKVPRASARKAEKANELEKERRAKDASTRKRSSDGDGIMKREGPVKREKGEG